MANHVVYVPGLNTKGPSEKAVFLRQSFDVVQLAYDPERPRESVERLAADLDRAAPDAVVVGSSLGGFYAYWLAKHSGRSALLLNPCVFPSRFLTAAPPALQAEYAALEAELYAGAPAPDTVVLLETGDEVLDYTVAEAHFQSRAWVQIFQGGSHRFENRQAILDALSLFFDPIGFWDPDDD
ncbi:MAG TPA: YqiA/YcfP family alpha/beta fold hydrolase [Acidobacteriota bacterium]|nr:YqiA/YcfP family alpha/beta fold hydrolase [Acidobacteriota bacterium]